ncbi:MAG: DNA translocase FtsK, partial [Acidobacteriota bacterium]|nr:DNA translocase FtsK [Acidobacteriota bacterium]
MATEVEKKQTVSKTYSRSNEIIAVVLLALAVLAFLCLVTYSPNDWSLNTASAQKTQNWVGVVGSVIADLLFQSIGLAAYFLPALLVLIAWRFFRYKDLPVSISRIIGYVLFVVSLSSLAALFDFYGGLLGAIFVRNLTWLLGGIGTGILLAAIFATSLLLITNLSLDSFFGNFRLAWENLRVHFDEWLAKRRARREADKEAVARLEKLNNVQNTKAQPKTPTISLGESVAAAKEKKGTISEKISATFNRLSKSPDEIKETPKVVEEDTEKKVEEKQEELSELAAEEPIKTIEYSTQTPTIETPDLIAEPEKILITPIQETGELDAGFPAEINAEPQKKTDREINFDNYQLPTSEFLTPPPPRIEQKDEELLSIAQELTDKTKEFNVTGRVMHICQGPVVTTYEFKPDAGVKYSRVTSLSDDLCLALKSESIRIERIPGKAFVGIEVPNRERETIFLREVIESKKFRDSKSLLTIALGKTIDGLNYVADLAKMPHLLIAGATGAGKSVGVNTLVVSILYKAKPDEVKFIMVDPKRLELGLYADIPHLATPIITDPKRAAISLKWAVSEMEKRYKDLAGWGVRNIDGFNTEVKKRTANEQFDDNGEPFKTLPYIVIIIDELADLMMVSGKEVEESITRLAQMARAVGIHLVLATQRPSVDVITGLIKANFPARISFRVSSKIDSRTIIDGNGAESLLGKGDMLFLPPATSQIIRVHGAFVDEKEIAKIVEHIKTQGDPEYDTTITKSEEEMDDAGDLPGRKDILFVDALRTVVNSKSASTSLLQRHLRIGYGR